MAEYNSQVVIDDLPQMGIGEYVTSSQFAVDVAENWQSEYLQFFLYIVLTVWLVQRGSPESKPVEDAGGEDDEKQKLGRHASQGSPAWAKAGGWRTTLYSNSLGLAMGLFFLGSWGAQLVAGTSAYNSERLQNLLAPISMPQYFASAELLEPHTAELAVGVPRGREHGRPQHLPSAAWVARVETRGVAAHRDRGRRLSRVGDRSGSRGNLRVDLRQLAWRLLPHRTAAHP